MPRLATPLSDAQVKRAKAGTKLIKLFDGHGLRTKSLSRSGRSLLAQSDIFDLG